jgi:hypothetical protein
MSGSILKVPRVYLLLFIMPATAIHVGCTSNQKKVISITSLLKEMADREMLTRFPDPGYKLLQASSWDRTEANPKDTSTWFNNKDYNNFIREEHLKGRTEYVIMEANGPGAITRWWIPQAAEMRFITLRIYLDGKAAPVIEEPYLDFMNGSSFVKWPFAFTSSDEKDAKQQYSMPVGHHKQMGADMYFPIPFAKGCKVTLDGWKPFYYAINYRLYDSGTKVISFSKEECASSTDLINAISAVMEAPPPPAKDSLSRIQRLEPGGTLELDLPQGGGKAIRSIQLNIHAKENKQKNRAAVLQLVLDGEQTVWSPVSEFFGGGVYARPVKNYDIGVAESGLMRVDWMMPYKINGKVILKNFGLEPIDAELSISVIDYTWDSRSMYFHADWHEEAPLNTPPFKDWNYVTISGKGIYVGDVLTIYSEPKGWYGEGDERIYVDGEEFPSHLGTGTEDYYGYAWGMANFFSSPFLSAPNRDARGKGDWRGYSTVARIRHLDAISFGKALKVDMEAWHPTHGICYSVTSFWYVLPGATDNVEKDEQAVVRKLPDFSGRIMEPLPGTVYPDPSEKGLAPPQGNGNIRQVGNHLDLLQWQDPEVKKPLDADGDNRYGTAGFHLIGVKRFDSDEMAMKTDSLQELPDFVQSIAMNKITHSFQDAWLFVPEKKSISYITGKIEVSGIVARKGLLTFVVNKKVPPSFRLGVMVDNADTFDKVGKSIWVKSSAGGDSGEIPLAKSNRYSDWYFFDVVDSHPGDKITIGGNTINRDAIFSIGAITFDVNNSLNR